jgi:hypothetical protein
MLIHLNGFRACFGELKNKCYAKKTLGQQNVRYKIFVAEKKALLFKLYEYMKTTKCIVQILFLKKYISDFPYLIVIRCSSRLTNKASHNSYPVSPTQTKSSSSILTQPPPNQCQQLRPTRPAIL